MSPSDPRLQSAVELHRANRLEEARDAYRQIVDDDPQRADALGLLGTTLRQLGQYSEAIEYLQRAAALEPQQATHFGNLGEAYRRLGHVAAAIAHYAQAARLTPHVAELHNNLGSLLQTAGQFDHAAAAYDAAIQCDPRYVEAHYNRGNLMQQLHRLPEAEADYRRALALQPDFVPALCNLGNLLRERRELEAALALLEKALQIDPDALPAVSNMGVVLQDLGRPDDALSHAKRAIELAPQRAELYVNLGTTYKDLGDPETALSCYERALELAPDNPQAAHSRGTALLALGNFEEGWAGYEYRRRCEQFDTRDFPQPQWRGEPLQGRTILIHAEQGLGDTLQFLRFVPQVIEQGGNAFVAVQSGLLPLLSRSGLPNLIPLDSAMPVFDVHVPLMSLPHVLGTRLDTLPADVPYVVADEHRVAAWRDRLQQHAGFRVGIVWQGRPTHHRDCVRSIPLRAFRPLSDVPQVRLISLQLGPGLEQREALRVAPGAERFDVIDPGPEYGSEGLLVDTAAVMKNLDLVIACDTGLAHLAGALAVPVWVALPVGAEWRWMLAREDSPWYPTMRLFRQSRLRDWDDVFARMSVELRRLAGDWSKKAASGTL